MLIGVLNHQQIVVANASVNPVKPKIWFLQSMLVHDAPVAGVPADD